MLYKELTIYDAKRWLEDINRDYFSCDALEVYFEFIDECFDKPIEFDPIALCCEWEEKHYSEIAKDYDIDLSESCDECQTVLNYLEDNTIAYHLNNGNIFYMIF